MNTLIIVLLAIFICFWLGVSLFVFRFSMRHVTWAHTQGSPHKYRTDVLLAAGMALAWPFVLAWQGYKQKKNKSSSNRI
jgi:hypothetical protein